ncbi:4a-hydroxytetrahydrobiopterin dehydratase [Nocardioides caeni]|uniref:Putative pterin-4-alpha-carbinolamine dehydratase n=1 Tax=Nocardioides caeni TaxID=574700 RepID=A0A4S8N3C9_9ACTN|nr:4a-hydroxytetrahydrobiopterin dehydratase [Nocardioides caeni]THV10052.1 4a-hydroxytetrahydrobiopterin dehydratase [Nocardioides caeni]
MGRHYEEIGAAQFESADGVADWRVRGTTAFALYRTGDFATAVRLVDEVGRLADAVDHHPDVNLRYGRVELRLTTHATSSLTTVDVDLARAISAAAAALAVTADPDGIAESEIAQG